MKNKLFAAALLALMALPMVGCGTKDVDPNAKVDAPGYYNGPMEKRGGGAGAGDDSKGGGAAATGGAESKTTG